MVRIKGGLSSQKRRGHLLEYTKGFKWGRKSKLRAAKTALMHAWEYAYRDRKAKKRYFVKPFIRCSPDPVLPKFRPRIFGLVCSGSSFLLHRGKGISL